MANSKKIVQFIISHEGGFVNDPKDSGGATNKGVTLNTFRSIFGNNKSIADLKKMTTEQWNVVFNHCFWNKINGDDISSDKIAAVITDFAWNSGVSRAVKYAQTILHVTVDGICGPKTVTALNGCDETDFVNSYLNDRRRFLLQSAGLSSSSANLYLAQTNPAKISTARSKDKDKKYIKGWLVRVNDLQNLVR